MEVKTDPKTYGVLERWWAIKFALIQAYCYWLLHPSLRVYTENTWTEISRYHYEEVITFVAVIKGSLADNNLQIIRWYYGNPRFDLDIPVDEHADI